MMKWNKNKITYETSMKFAFKASAEWLNLKSGQMGQVNEQEAFPLTEQISYLELLSSYLRSQLCAVLLCFQICSNLLHTCMY